MWKYCAFSLLEKLNIAVLANLTDPTNIVSEWHQVQEWRMRVGRQQLILIRFILGKGFSRLKNCHAKDGHFKVDSL